MAGVYLMLLMQFLENKVAMELTRTEFVEAQEALMEMRSWFVRFPTILQPCENIIEMLRGQYAHCVACYDETAFHFVEASKLTESKSAQAICQVYAAVSYICIGDPDSYAKANFNDKYEEYRKKWGGRIMGSKSQAKMKAKERVLAKEAAKRLT